MRKTRLALFLLVFFAYAYVHGGGGWNPDSRLDLLHSIVVHHTLRIDAYAGNTGDKSLFDGHYYSDKAPGTAFLALPAFTAGAAMLHLMHIPLDSGDGWYDSSWIATAGSVGIIAALGAVAIFSILAGYIGSRKAFITTIAVFLGSLPYPYSIMLWSHGEVIGLLSIALWCALTPASAGKRTKDSRVSLLPYVDLIGGLCCGLAVVSEYTTGLAAVGLGMLFLRKGWKPAMRFLAAASLPLAALLLYNWACYGTPLSFGYSHVDGWDGMKQGFFGITFRPSLDPLLNLLFYPSRGLFFWTPFFTLAVPGFFVMHRRFPALNAVALIVVVLHVLAISGYAYWDGGRALGPRHFAAIIPFMALAAGFGLTLVSDGVGMVLAALSILFSGLCGIVDPGAPFQRNPFTEYYLPELAKGTVRRNFGNLAGLHGLWSIVPLFVILLLVLTWMYVSLPAVGTTAVAGLRKSVLRKKPLLQRGA